MATCMETQRTLDGKLERETVVDEACWDLVALKWNCEPLRSRLEALSLYDATRSIRVHVDADQVALPIRADQLGSVLRMPFSARLEKALKVSTEKQTQRDKLRSALKAWITENGTKWTVEMEAEVPTRWERHGDLVLLPARCFEHAHWTRHGTHFEEEEEERKGNELELWRRVASALGAERIALKGPITGDRFRSPRVQLMLGGHGWVTHKDNGIKYSYDVTKCMFSAGNISEKLRIAKLKCNDEVVVDLYAGIGYFTLPYLVHAKASFVHACEWNPDSVEALERNIVQNGVRDRCEIHFGDNRLVTPEGVAQRVNLGLIPSSEAGWVAACKALDPSTGGALHVHGNVTTTRSATSASLERRGWAETVRSQIGNIFRSIHGTQWTVSIEHIERVKSYAPHIDHLVVDLLCTPQPTHNSLVIK